VGALRDIGGGKKLTPPMDAHLHEVSGVFFTEVFFNTRNKFHISMLTHDVLF
jgi:hypothetical protein